VQEHKSILKVPANAISFVPPEDYFTAATTLLPDSVKQFWGQKIAQGGQKTIQKGVDLHAGYIWLKDSSGIYPVHITKGLSDGVFTEVTGAVKEGDIVVTGLNKSQAPASSKQQTTQNPFMPKMPTRKTK
jgi:hypothetical protein